MADRAWDAVIRFDANFIVRAWDVGAQRLFGWTADEAIGRHISDLTPGDGDRMGRMTLLQRGIDWHGTVVVVDKHGEMVAIENWTVPERDFLGAVTGYVGRSRRLPEPRSYTDLVDEESSI